MAGGNADDRFMEEAREEAEEAELVEDSARRRLAARESAEGVEVFEAPESTLSGSTIRDGEPDRESLSGDRLELHTEDDEDSVED